MAKEKSTPVPVVRAENLTVLVAENNPNPTPLAIRFGYSEENMKRWHAAFEAQASEAHRKFLESLGLGTAEVKAIRGWARGGG